MYNRYIPKPDGTYQKNRMQEPSRKPETPPIPMPAPIVSDFPTQQNSCIDCPKRNQSSQVTDYMHKPPMQNVSTLRFLKQLLPREFDAEDLLVVLLLLLMTGDSREDQNSALLTMLLYLFL